MKYLSRILAVFLFVGLSSCDNTELDLLTDPNNISPDRASVNDLYNNIQLTFNSAYQNLQGTSGSLSRMYSLIGGFNYEASVSPQTLSGLWFNTYSGMFPDIDALDAISEERGFDIHSGTAKIMKAYVLMGMVDLMGNIPLSQAGQGTDVISPTADPGDQVYASAVSLLDEAIAQLSGTTAPAPATDQFYGGDVAKWITLAKTLKLRAAVTTRLVDANAGSTINALVAEGDLIDEASEDFQYNYGNQRTNPNSRHPFYNQHYEIGDGPYLSNYYMWLLRVDKEDENGASVIDPRIRFYFYRKVEKADEQDQTTYSCHFSILPDPAATPAHYTAVDSRMPYCIVLAGDGYSGRDHLNGEGIPPDGPIRTSFGLYPGGGMLDINEYLDTRQQGTTGGLGQGIWPIMLSSFVDFMRAEAALTAGTSDDARALLESGIRKSMDKVIGFKSLIPSTLSKVVEVRGVEFPVEETFVPTEEDIDAYVDFVLAQYDASSDQLDVVMKEFYIALWGNGLEAYNMWRRTGKPANMQPGIEPNVGEYVRSFFLPDVHVNRNANATQKALTDQVFWDNGATSLY